MKTGGAPWKCRAVENEENQTQVSLISPSPWKSLLRFPHFHRAAYGPLSSPKRTRKNTERSPTLRLPDFIPSGSFLD